MMPNNEVEAPKSDTLEIYASTGYQRLLKAVEQDEARTPAGERHFHNYRAKLEWVIARARHYAEKTQLSAAVVLDAWERDRDYWYMNWYQECNQPEINGRVRVFDTSADMRQAIGTGGFRCPACNVVSSNPYECSCAQCDWKVYGLLKDLGKGIIVLVRQEFKMQLIFMPVAWEAD
jgi:hypothetical protein